MAALNDFLPQVASLMSGGGGDAPAPGGQGFFKSPMEGVATGLKMTGALYSGFAARSAAESAAAQAEAAAGQIEAAGGRAAADAARQGRFMQSTALARAAASGAGASDPTVLKIISDIAGEGEYRSMLALYDARSRATGLRYQADVSRAQGEAAMTSSILSAGGSLLAGADKSLFEKYGKGGPGGDSYDPEVFREWNDDNYFR